MTSCSLTAIIIAKNCEKNIERCIEALSWCSEILVVNDASTDNTAMVAERLGGKVIHFSHNSFARLREEGLKYAKGDWVFYIDADERVTPGLAKEIMVNVELGEKHVFSVARNNYHYGKLMVSGGWQKDVMERIFRKDSLRGWRGNVHESPIYDGVPHQLKIPLIHLTHVSTIDNLKKSIDWTPIEAKALSLSKPKIGPLLILRKFSFEFIRRYVLWKGFRDGEVGFIESFVQAINRALVYIQVWEHQTSPSISESYEEIEKKVREDWKKNGVLENLGEQP